MPLSWSTMFCTGPGPESIDCGEVPEVCCTLHHGEPLQSRELLFLVGSLGPPEALVVFAASSLYPHLPWHCSWHPLMCNQAPQYNSNTGVCCCSDTGLSMVSGELYSRWNYWPHIHGKTVFKTLFQNNIICY